MKLVALYTVKALGVVLVGGLVVKRLGPRAVLRVLVLGVLDEWDRIRDARG